MRNSLVCLGLILSSTPLDAAPVFTQVGVVNAASYAAGPLSAGSLATIFGTGFSASTAAASSLPLPTMLAGVTVKLNGAAVPLLFVSANQINFQVPWELAGSAQAGVTVGNGAGASSGVSSDSSAEVSVSLAAVAPAIFTSDGKQAVAYIAALNRPRSRAGRPGEYLRVYATGLGNVANPPGTGNPPDGSLFVTPIMSETTAVVTATVGGVAATVSFAGLAPQGINPAYVGIYEVDVRIPSGTLSGPAIPIVISVNGAASNTAMIAIDSNPAPLIARWLQLGPSGAMARAITTRDACPFVGVDGQPVQMQTRSRPDLPFYPVTSCELAIPATASSAMLEQVPLPLPKKGEYTKITVIGDTGCRLDTSGATPVYQACNDPDQWPVAKNAVGAAATSPDLIVFTGDYHYREAPCPANNAGCVGSPWGYNWDVWYADLFSQVQPAFDAAPVFFIRGNHELCERAGDGWFRYLDPRPMPDACEEYTDPFAVTAGSLQLIHVDSAVADDNNALPDQIDAYKPQFEKVRRLATGNAWLLTHRPLWTIRSGSSTNVVMQSASGNSLPDGIQMVLSGHTHIFQTYTFQPGRAPQIVIGNGGDVLNAVVPAATLLGQTIGGAQVTQAASKTHFGFSTVNSTNGGWIVTDRAVDGTPVTACVVANKAVTCDVAAVHSGVDNNVLR
ncbi:MAG: metallophosphoesterase [Bryobacteraceae bacterium]